MSNTCTTCRHRDGCRKQEPPCPEIRCGTCYFMLDFGQCSNAASHYFLEVVNETDECNEWEKDQ